MSLLGTILSARGAGPIAPTVNVAVVPTLFVRSDGCAMMVGGTPTVNTALVLVTEPWAFAEIGSRLV